MKKLCLLFSCLLALSLLAPISLAEDTAPVETIAFDVSESGDVLTVTLAGNATTGFTWTWSQPEGGPLQALSNDYTPDEAADGQVGVGGTSIITFGAAENGVAGLTTLTFTYAQAWAPDEAAVAYELDINLAEDGTLSTEEARQVLPFPWTIGDTFSCPACGGTATITEIIYQGDEETGISILITAECPECGTIGLAPDDLGGKPL